MSHTPGPWTWNEEHYGLLGVGPDNVVLSYQPYEGMLLSGFDSSKANANARLIASAPDLLAELQSIATAKRFDTTLFPDDEAFCIWAQSKARDAIAKATEQT